jgi:ParB family chromosome partitioning protein
VVGGKRRLKALNELAQEGDIARDEGIVCRVKPTREAAEASLAENLHREPMHPADEFEAFERLVQEGRSIEDVALRFGTSPLTVRRRLKLAGLHPNLIQLYREDGVTLEQLMALSVSDDPEEQWRVWETTPSWRRQPSSLRVALVADEIDAEGDPLAQLVGLDAYEAAGGRVRRDLFSEEGAGYLQDGSILDRLAAERLDAAAESVRAEGWSWVDVVPRATGGELFAFGRCPKTRREMTKAEAKKHKTLAVRAQRLQAEREADNADDEEAERHETELDAVERELDEFERTLETYADDAFTVGGAVVCVARGGRTEVHRGLIRPADRKARHAQRGRPGPEHTEGESDSDMSAGDSPARPVHSAALMLDLTAHRTLAARAVLLDHPDLALCALLDCLVQRPLYGGHYAPTSAVRLAPNAPDAGLLPKPGSGLDDARAWHVIAEAKEHWGNRLPGDVNRLLPWLIALNDSDRMDLLALCVALTLNDVRDTERRGPLDALCTTLELDVADWWEATAASYFSRVTKEAILNAVAEGAGAQAAAQIKGVSKAELATLAERELKDKRWLPTPLRPVVETSIDDGAHSDE